MNTDETLHPTDRETGPKASRQPTVKDLVPWEGKPTRTDKALIGLIFGIPAFYLATMPFRPFLIAKAPVLLELVVGSKTAIGAAAAYASIGQLPLWLVVVAGVVGVAKFDWVFWLAGRRWGDRALRTFAASPGNQKWVDRIRNLPAWVMPLLVAAGRLPGMPGPIIWILAGLNRMRLRTFLVCDLISAAIITSAVTTAGYLAGQRGVDLLSKIDSYAVWISLGIVVVLAGWQARKESRRRSVRVRAGSDG